MHLTILSKTDMRQFARAKQMARVSDYKKTHVGCVITYQGNIVSTGCNLNKTHPLQEHYNAIRNKDIDSYLPAKIHAEINCISNCKNLDIKWDKVKLYVYREMKEKPYGMARPCPSCMAAIKELGIKNIYYTTDSGYAYEYLED